MPKKKLTAQTAKRLSADEAADRWPEVQALLRERDAKDADREVADAERAGRAAEDAGASERSRPASRPGAKPLRGRAGMAAYFRKQEEQKQRDREAGR